MFDTKSQNPQNSTAGSDSASYRELQKFVESGELKLFYIFSIPRSCSTALEVAIKQSPMIDGQFNEPFYVRSMEPVPHDYNSLTDIKHAELDIRNFSEGFSNILGKFHLLREKLKKDKISMIVKDHVSVFDLNHFLKILSLTDDVMFTIRNPLHLCASHVIRSANDCLTPTGKELDNATALTICHLLESNEFTLEKFSRLESNNIFSKKRIMDVLQKPHDTEVTMNLLEEIYHVVIQGTLKWFSASWDNFNLYHRLDQLTSGNSNFVIVDAAHLTDSPIECMKEISNRLPNLEYHDVMVNGWEESKGDLWSDGPESEWGKRNAIVWKSTVENSQGLGRQKTGVNWDVKLEELPRGLQSAAKRALDIYNNIDKKNFLKGSDS